MISCLPILLWQSSKPAIMNQFITSHGAIVNLESTVSYELMVISRCQSSVINHELITHRESMMVST